MNEKIEKILEDYCTNEGCEHWANDNELYGLLEDFDVLYEEKTDSHRWWDTYRTTIKVGDTYIGFISAKTTGDMNAREAGWDFESDTLCEMLPVKKTVTTYIRKGKNE